MDANVKTLWITALRSGEFMQGQGQLRTGDKFCCLGVLSELAKREGLDVKAVNGEGHSWLYASQKHFLPQIVAEWAGVTEFNDKQKLMNMNDGGDSFEEIADWIDGNL